MAEIIGATWTDDAHTTITVTVTGAMVVDEGKSALDPEGETTMFVPDNPLNRHRQALAAWEAEGNIIADAPAD